MDNQNKIFKEFEEKANEYVVRCLLVAGAIGGGIWFLNIINVFTVNDVVMNTTMPIGILILIPLLF